MVAYCRTGQETHSWRILSCPPVSGATMTDQDCNETTKQRSIITNEHHRSRLRPDRQSKVRSFCFSCFNPLSDSFEFLLLL